MKRSKKYLRQHGPTIGWLLLAVAGLGCLLLHRLGSLTGGLSSGEMMSAAAPVGWHGIYHDAFYLPLKVVRSLVFVLFKAHGQTLTRLPDAFFGGLAIISFGWLIRLWHGTRTAVLTGLLFATSAWVLHVSRLASFDVMYLWATPTLLLTHVLLQKYNKQALVWYGSLIAWGLLLYVPGLVWLVGLVIYLQRGSLWQAWRHFGRWWQRLLYLLASLVWLPLLVVNLLRPGNFLAWLGWPAHPAAHLHMLKQFAAVPVHLFIRGPEYPQLWLGRAPILDIFALAACVIGIYFYVTHWRAARTRLLALLALAGFVLVGLGGPVGLSLLVPLLYVAAATGITYLLHEWLHVFPNNPLARSLGLGLIILAVSLSSVYNLQAYFVAWPHNTVTRTIFQYRR
jgi:hypothetical protein